MTTRILIMAGGTGGHVFPALAVADELHARQCDVFWMGTKKGIEAKLVPTAGYPIHYISVQGLRGNGALGWLLAPFKLIKSISEAVVAIRQIRPDVVFGLGGFASGPGGVAARLLAKPVVIHEQNAIPGLTNRLLSLVARRVLQGFPNSFAKSRHAEWVGNPVRTSIESLAAPKTRLAERSGPVRILVLGGSLGAKSLNTVLPDAFAQITSAIEIKHQCGVRHLDECQKNYKASAVTAEITAFIDDMADAYAWADLVICRAGALTVAEVSAAGVAALFIPYPYAVDDHQTHNATSLVDAGAAKLIQESDLTANSFATEINQLISKRDSLLAMATRARKQAKTGTAQQLADICLEVAHG
ncbi:MAG: undecaprenyldiphospho-muramoylpentapeptide beta-N-acetylglucosaminyltransferase [Gammaproteobacteria bacterium]|nr:undecaprenyldiphospho-muramoylpentapeptide beta-N-acetylglucosaminyltransferase [Gammaproteobacteria bacterium]